MRHAATALSKAIVKVSPLQWENLECFLTHIQYSTLVVDFNLQSGVVEFFSAVS
jgi:hypothetical protein